MGRNTSHWNVPCSSQCVAKHLTARINDPGDNLADYRGVPQMQIHQAITSEAPWQRTPSGKKRAETNRRTSHIQGLHTMTPPALVCQSETNINQSVGVEKPPQVGWSDGMEVDAG